MILWTSLPLEYVLEGFNNNTYAAYEASEVAGIPVLLEKIETGQRRVVRINSTDPTHFLRKDVYPGLVTT
ncbi:YlzJ-like family protein [Desulforamulus reducens]|uniref:YlzJ-like family protein n=1 Tax=Desulforamulus reducens TaxID=59610 RepID=UPI0003023625|nr:YlzJ-like family protein [Desulforamulus reducens]